jgi:hypothetical protein
MFETKMIWFFFKTNPRGNCVAVSFLSCRANEFHCDFSQRNRNETRYNFLVEFESCVRVNDPLGIGAISLLIGRPWPGPVIPFPSSQSRLVYWFWLLTSAPSIIILLAKFHRDALQTNELAWSVSFPGSARVPSGNPASSSSLRKRAG